MIDPFNVKDVPKLENPGELVDYYQEGKFVEVMTKLEALARGRIVNHQLGLGHYYYKPHSEDYA
jgi:hypothetical protein